MTDAIKAGLAAAGIMLLLPPCDSKAAVDPLSPDYQGDLGEIPGSGENRTDSAETKPSEPAKKNDPAEDQSQKMLERDAAAWRTYLMGKSAAEHAPAPDSQATDCPPLPSGLVYVDRNFEPLTEKDLKERVLHDSKNDLPPAERQEALRKEQQPQKPVLSKVPAPRGGNSIQVLNGSDFTRTH